jgi:N-methylhydantoinase A
MLGRLDPARFAGGRLKLEPQRAREALDRCSREGKLELSAEEFAGAVAELVDEAMANAARVHAVESGKTLAERTLIAFGGAAPLHVARVAEKLGIARILVPVNAGVGSAVGFLRAPIAYEVARSFYVRLRQFAAEPVNAMFAAMAEEARGIVSRGAQGQPLTERRTAFARYIGQGHEVPLDVPPRALRDPDAEALRRGFEAAYLERYGRLIEGVDIEILGWTLSVSTPVQEPEASTPMRRVKRVSGNTHSRDALTPGCEIAGPALIVEDSTTTVVPAGFDAAIAADGTIVLTRQ